MPPPTDSTRVLHVIGSLDPRMGGLPRAALGLALAQRKVGAQVRLLYVGRGPEEEPELRRAYGHLPGFPELPRCVLPPNRILAALTGRDVRQAMDKFQPGVVHTHGLWEPLLWHAQRHALATGIPFVVCPHGMLHPWHDRHQRLAKFLLTRVLGWRQIWRRAAFLHALNPEEDQRLRRAGFANVRMLPNGIFPEEDPLPERSGPRDDPAPFLLFLSRLHPQKAPDRLLEAFALLAPEFPALRLVLAGPDGGMQDELEERAEQLGLADRVLFPGMLTGLEKWEALHTCAVFCLPSNAEGCSLALLEAGRAGAPILMTANCHFQTLAESGGAALCPDTPEGMADALRRLLRQPAAAHEMGCRARAFVLAQHHWCDIARRMLALYRSPGAFPCNAPASG